MNSSNPSSNDITRRDFMKKSALTVGAITLLAQGIGLAAGTDGSGSGWWDMKCASPTDGGDRVFENIINPAVGDLPELTFEVSLETDRIAELPEDSGYNNKTFTHDFYFRVSSATEQSSLPGRNSFDSQCDIYSGVITTTYNQFNSDPQGDTTMTGESTLGEFISYEVTIVISRSASGNSASTTIFADVVWTSVNDPSIGGSFTLPKNGRTLEISNNFQAKHHR